MSYIIWMTTRIDTVELTNDMCRRIYLNSWSADIVCVETMETTCKDLRVRGSVPGLGGLKETKLFLPHPRVKVSNVGSLRDREVACSASDRQGSNFESCVWRTVSSQSSHHPQEVLLAQFSLYVHKYCKGPPWPRGSVFGLGPPGLEFRILCAEIFCINHGHQGFVSIWNHHRCLS